MTQPTSTLTRRRLIAAAVIAAVLPATPALAARRRLRGNVVYRERMALPRGARVTVELVDVSLADAPSQTIARTRIAARAGSPIPYVLQFDSARIRPRRVYALQARITLGGRLLFINTTHHGIEPRAGGRMDIMVERVADRPPAR